MALDTQANRRRAVNFGRWLVYPCLPVASGAITANDAMHMLNRYQDTSAVVAASTERGGLLVNVGTMGTKWPV